MINFDEVVKENVRKHNLNWPQFLDHLYRIITAGGSRSQKPNELF